MKPLGLKSNSFKYVGLLVIYLDQKGCFLAFMVIMNLMKVFLSKAFILIIRLPPRCPLYQLVPILALVFSAKTSNSPNLLILKLYCDVGLAHEALPYEVDAMSNMGRGCHHGHFILRNLHACGGGFLQSPVSFTNPILSRSMMNLFGENPNLPDNATDETRRVQIVSAQDPDV